MKTAHQGSGQAVAVRRALLSVSDKTGLEGFARMLSQLGVELVATGGTKRLIQQAGIDVREVAEVTGSPEMMDGRVKTLHPKIHGGILALRDDAGHLAALEEHEIGAIDLVVVNLYPFEETVAKSGVTRAQAIEEIDIGGPTMVRAAAKNHAHVAIVTDPGDYGRVLDELQKDGGRLSFELRRELAVKAFALTARYDAAIGSWLFGEERRDGLAGELPPSHAAAGVRARELRYGENPHQKAAFYSFERAGREASGAAAVEPSVAAAEFLGGKDLSYNNIVDLDAALALAAEFEDPFVCVCKHNNPCGAAAAETIEQALEEAWAGDPLSAFGSVLAFTRPVNAAAADFLVAGNRFVEAIIAPSFDDDALEALRTKPKWGKNVRLLACGAFGPAQRDAEELDWKSVRGGFLLQSRDLKNAERGDLEVKTRSEPSDEELVGLLFADRVCKHVKSNAIVIAKGTRVLGVGAGQMSRVDSVAIALRKAGDEVGGAVLASDAFFPFPDGAELAMDAGVRALLQPGGSIRDKAVVEACDQREAAMVFSGLRHFRH